MNVKRKWGGGLIALIGFMLSPLSWWNDLFVNVPLAVGFGWLLSLLYEPAFQPAVIVGYWLTNVLGFVLMHKGARQMLTAGQLRPYSRRDLLKDLGVSLLYTLVILVLIQMKFLQPARDYFKPATP